MLSCPRRFIALSKVEYLLRLSKSLPQSVLARSWPPATPHTVEASKLLHKLHTSWLARKYCFGLTAARKRQLELKVQAEQLFKGELTAKLL